MICVLSDSIMHVLQVPSVPSTSNCVSYEGEGTAIIQVHVHVHVHIYVLKFNERSIVGA